VLAEKRTFQDFKSVGKGSDPYLATFFSSLVTIAGARRLRLSNRTRRGSRATTKIPELSRSNQGFWFMVSDARTDLCDAYVPGVSSPTWGRIMVIGCPHGSFECSGRTRLMSENHLEHRLKRPAHLPA
jgi:hypothetical protein